MITCCGDHRILLDIFAHTYIFEYNALKPHFAFTMIYVCMPLNTFVSYTLILCLRCLPGVTLSQLPTNLTVTFFHLFPTFILCIGVRVTPDYGRTSR